MLGLYLKECIADYLLISLILGVSAGYVYRVNSKRTTNDPLKQHYHPYAVWLTPIWPLLVLGWMIFFIVCAVLFGVCLLITAVLLVVFRKPFLIEWVKKTATQIGSRLLKINSFLIRLITLPFRRQLSL
ncbi:MAG TPA: hypothetical protein VK851_08260 [Anaerolineales bacterium]|nr:hypothetical protein [Anaerolineales bacterium]